MIKATKIIHKEEQRIKVDFPYNQHFIYLLRQVEGAKWSQTHKAWHIPYTKEAFGKLKSLFPDILVNETQNERKIENKPKETEPIVATTESILPLTSSVLVEIIGKKIILKLPKNDLDTKFILTLRFSKFDKAQRIWIIPNYPGNLELIKAFFKDRISNIIIHKEVEVKTGK